ncbi:MAG: LysR family transcriptional regulator [Ruminococcaceae bacterium]|nr:LysR family transcriptional regulator [Oscillospiraceae bacterium]
MNSKQLQYALRLSKTLSFSFTAEEFKISQPALSKQISNLEKDLGVKLFDRRKNPISLTAAGEYFFKETENILYQEEQLRRSMQDFNLKKRGKLVIGISPFRSLYLVKNLCKAVREKYPNVKIVLNEHPSDQLRKLASEGKFDFAVVNLPVDESVLDIRLIEQDTLVLVVPKSMLSLIKYSPGETFNLVDFKDCKKLPFIVLGPSQEMHHLFKKICSTAEIQPNIAMEVVGITTAWTMAHNGLGATLLPYQFVKSMNYNDEVELFIPKCEMNIRQPAIITRRGQYLPEYAKYAIDILSGEVKK